MHWVADFTKPAQLWVTGLPDTALAQLEQVMEDLEARAGDDEPDPVDPRQRSRAFGVHDEGVLTYWLDQPQMKIWVTSVVWLD